MILEQIYTLFKPLSFINIELLILGSVAHSLVRLIPLLRATRRVNWKKWFNNNFIPHTLATVVALILLLLISHVPELVEKFGKLGIKFVSFSLGFSGDYAVLHIERIIGWKNQEKQTTK